MKADEKKSAFDLHAGPQLESPWPRASYMESDSPHEGARNSRGSVWAHSSISQREVGKKNFTLLFVDNDKQVAEGRFWFGAALLVSRWALAPQILLEASFVQQKKNIFFFIYLLLNRE